MDLKYALDDIKNFTYQDSPEGQRGMTVGTVPTGRGIENHIPWVAGEWFGDAYQNRMDMSLTNVEFQKK